MNNGNYTSELNIKNTSYCNRQFGYETMKYIITRDIPELEGNLLLAEEICHIDLFL